MQRKIKIILAGIIFMMVLCGISYGQSRITVNFNKGWEFQLEKADTPNMAQVAGSVRMLLDSAKWLKLDLPHDWSIEGQFSKDHPTTFNQAALPAGIGWYRKEFTLPLTGKGKRIFINFDGVYKNSEVWINGEYLGKRPNGYSSFRYELTKFLRADKNVIAVKVDNSLQPDSRWYTGSGIYRKVWLQITNKIAVEHWGTFVTTPEVDDATAKVSVKTNIISSTGKQGSISVQTIITDRAGKIISEKTSRNILIDSEVTVNENVIILNPHLWSVNDPYLYKVKTVIRSDGDILDEYETPLGIRYFHFDAAKGFFLNGRHLKILGVCNHHDLGALGAAVNYRAIERQLEILKRMGCNAIRTAHNPPATELLELCDKMGFIVMDEAFDMWKKRKNRQDYHVDFDKWHQRDLEDMVLRDRNHPSVFMWSIGNEIREQFDSTGIVIAKRLADIVKNIDPTRPVTSGLTENVPEKNFIYRSGALDVLGFNYKFADYPTLPQRFPGQKFIASETMSGLATRGHYDMPSDSLRLWPPDSKSHFKGNDDLTVSAYDHVFAYWGSTHEAGWNAVKKFDFISGLFVWSGFDFLGEPVPYKWPARSSYYGIIDLAGFPKDVYYMYQSEWTTKPVLYIFPHWTWQPGKVIDVWAYYNNADEVELYLNGRSLGTRKKHGDTLHVMWRVAFQPGTLKVISRKKGKQVLVREVKTAGKPARIALVADRKIIRADGSDLSFVTVRILDKNGILVPNAQNDVTFNIKGNGKIEGVDNGLQTSMESFKSNHRKTYNGQCLVIIQSKSQPGNIELTANTKGIQPSKLVIQSK